MALALRPCCPSSPLSETQGLEEASGDGYNWEVEREVRVRGEGEAVHREAAVRQPGAAVLGLRHMDSVAGQGTVHLTEVDR